MSAKARTWGGVAVGTLVAIAAFFVIRAALDGEPSGDDPNVAEQTEVEVRFRSGLDLARRYQLHRALSEFESCLKLRPADARAKFQRGRILVAFGRRAEGVRDLEAAIASSPNDMRMRRYLFDLFVQDPQLKNPTKARQHYEVLKTASRGLIALDVQVHKAMRQGAIETYTFVADQVRGRRGQLSGASMELYDAFFPGGNESRGVQGIPGFATFVAIFRRCPGLFALRQAVALQLSNPSRLGLPILEDETLPGSKVQLTLADHIFDDLLDHTILFSADSIDLVVILAMLQMKMGDYAEASSRFRNFLQLDRQSTVMRQQAEFQLAVCHYKLGQPAKAIPTFRALANDPLFGLYASWFRHITGDDKMPMRRPNLPEQLAAGFRFEDMAAKLGVAKMDGGGGSTWGDYDGDGDLDLYVSGIDTFSALYRYDGERFNDVSVDVGLASINSGFTNVFVDYDNDGDLDLFVARDGWAGPMANSLLENRGGKFVDVTRESGLLAGRPASSFSASWADFDRDGDLDLFVANGICGDGSTCRLWKSDGGGKFTDVTVASGLQEKTGVRTIGCAVGDYDLDGWTDIFLSEFEPTPSRLYHNRGDGTFEEVAAKAGVENLANLSSGFVAVMEDLNGDTLPDIFMTKWEPDFSLVMRAATPDFRPSAATSKNVCRLFVNRGDGTFRDDTDAAGFLYPHGTMGVGVADLNNDGNPELYLGNGGPEIERLEPDSFYIGLGGGRFVEAGGLYGLDHLGKGHGVTFADFDDDGDLDVYVPLGGAYHGDQFANAFYVNLAGPGGHWLQVALEGTKSPRMGVGARVEVIAGSLKQQREMKCGIAFGSGDAPYLHFGLGSNESIESLVVHWTSGAVDRFEEVPIDRLVRVKEGRPTLEVRER